jgi:hypothetical protein
VRKNKIKYFIVLVCKKNFLTVDIQVYLTSKNEKKLFPLKYHYCFCIQSTLQSTANIRYSSNWTSLLLNISVKQLRNIREHFLKLQPDPTLTGIYNLANMLIVPMQPHYKNSCGVIPQSYMVLYISKRGCHVNWGPLLWTIHLPGFIDDKSGIILVR